MNNSSLNLLALFVACTAGFTAVPLRAEEPDVVQIDSIMYEDPAIAMPVRQFAFPRGLKPLLLQALQRPEADLQRQAAQAIVRAHSEGMQQLQEAVPRLAQLLEQDPPEAAVRAALVRALIALEATETAELLHKHAGEGLLMAEVIEPALADWNYQPIQKQWLARVNDPDVSRPLRILAIRGLAATGQQQAVGPLKQLARSSSRVQLRIEAARALSQMQAGGRFELAREIAEENASLINRLTAVALLENPPDDAQAVDLLAQWSGDSEPAVAAAALESLQKVAPERAADAAAQAVASADARVRQVAAQALVAVADVPRIAILTPLLDDPHPEVRNYVRENLLQLAGSDPRLDEAVREQAMQVLAKDSWRGLEQANRLLGALDHEPATERMMELLEHERAEVLVTAGWALRKLEVADTLAPLLEYAEAVTAEIQRGATDLDHRAQQLSQIYQLFGRLKYQPAETLLLTYVPKKPALGHEARAAAIWTLGHLNAGQPDESLVKQLSGRLMDMDPFNPEDMRVWRASAVTIGRMNAESGVDVLRTHYGMYKASSNGQAAAWAVEQITGEDLPPPEVPLQGITDWFLEPLETLAPPASAPASEAASDARSEPMPEDAVPKP